MQQAYSAIRVISEAQTVRIVLSTHPGVSMLNELCAACASLNSPGSEGIKAVVLDFTRLGREDAIDHDSHAPPEKAYRAIQAVAQPVLAIARDTLSPAACGLLAAADMTLVNADAMLVLANTKQSEAQDVMEAVRGSQAARLGYVTWAASIGDLNREMERILKLLREKSAVALRLAKAGARLGQAQQATPLEALQRINALYLTKVMQTQDAAEGLRAFLEKRKPTWKNR
jgi:enoyl-CoA hydratase/carnithine racemase